MSGSELHFEISAGYLTTTLSQEVETGCAPELNLVKV